VNPAWYVLLGFLLLVLLGEPLFVTIGIVTLLLFNLVAAHPQTLEAVTQTSTPVILAISELSKSEVLISIPLFTLAGTIMTRGEMSGRLIAIARALVGWLPGGLAMACVVACTFFAAISGSSSVTIIAVGGMLYPALKKEGYPEGFALGLITICGAIGTLIPPSLPLIVYGVVAANSVTSGKPSIDDLFRAGIGPSILTVFVLCAYSLVRGVMLRIPRTRFSPGDLVRSLRSGAFALVMPVLLLGLIYGGFSTVHEASAMAVLYALLVETVIHRAVKPRDLPAIALESLVLVGSILIILVMALALTNYLTDAKIPDMAADMMRYDRAYDAAEYEVYVGKIVRDDPAGPLVISPKDDPGELHEIARADLGWTSRPLVESRLGFVIGVNILLLIVGCIMDIFSGVIVLAPLLVPMAQSYGVSLVHLGIIFAFNLELGFVTPPFGINLFISQSFFRKPMSKVVLSCAPFLVVMLLLLGAVTYWPTLSLWLAPGGK